MLTLLLSLVFSLNFQNILAVEDICGTCDEGKTCVLFCDGEDEDPCSCWEGECKATVDASTVGLTCDSGLSFEEEGNAVCVCDVGLAFNDEEDDQGAVIGCVDITSIGECPDEDEGGDDQGEDGDDCEVDDDCTGNEGTDLCVQVCDEDPSEGECCSELQCIEAAADICADNQALDEDNTACVNIGECPDSDEDDEFLTDIGLGATCGDDFGECDGVTVCCASFVIRRRLLSDEQGEDDDEDDDEDENSEDEPDTGVCVATAGDCTSGGGQVFTPDNALVNNGEAETNAFGMKDATPAETGSIWAVIVIGAIIICSVSVWGIYQFVAKKKALTKLEGMQGTQQKSADSSEYGHDGSTATVSSQ